MPKGGLDAFDAEGSMQYITRGDCLQVIDGMFAELLMLR